jgi:hypothetical protein
MGSSNRSPRNQQDRQQPYANGQTAEPAAPMVAWPNEEARQTVIQTNDLAWRSHTAKARGHRDNAARMNNDLAELNRQYAELGKAMEKLADDLRREQHYDRQEQATADGYAAALTALGATVSADVLVHPPLTPQGDSSQHAAAFGGPAVQDPHVDPFPENRPDGHCVYCGQMAWRVPVSDRAPNGASHGIGAACQPDNPQSQFARLSDELQAREVVS